MNSTTITLASYLASAQMQMIRILLTPAYTIGNLNNLANILIFSQSSLRTNICSWYFIGASMGHIFYLNMGCLPRVILGWTQYDLGLISLSYCIARLYFVLDGLTISRYLFCLIAIDRWMITSRNNRIRQRSSSKVARRLIIVGVLFLIIVNIFIPLWYVFDKYQGCVPPPNPIYTIFYIIYNIALSLVPLITLLVFSLLTIFNIRSTRHHHVSPVTRISVNPEALQRRPRYNKKDVQFMKLSFIQVVGYVLFNTLHAYNTIYSFIITQHSIKTDDQRAIDAFMFGVGLNLHYTYTGITFFLYTIASKTFRKACLLLFKRWTKRLLTIDVTQA